MIAIAGLALIVLLIITIIIAAAARPAGGEKIQNNMSLKKAYLYLVSVISLIIAVVGAIILLNMALKTWIFPKADNYSYYPACTKNTTDGKEAAECDPQEEERQRKAEEERRSAQRQGDAAQALAMIIVASPIWWYHWTQARKEA